MDFLANLIILLAGYSPESYLSSEDKWAAVFAILTAQIVPYGQIILFILPFVIVYFWYQSFTWKRFSVALVTGVLLAWGAYEFDMWLLEWGAGQTYKAIYGPDGI